jgi:hypothetical protein
VLANCPDARLVDARRCLEVRLADLEVDDLPPFALEHLHDQKGRDVGGTP